MPEDNNGLPKDGTPAEPNPAEPTPVEPTPPEDGTPEPKVDWEKRYKDLQTDHTRTRQRVAELEAKSEQPSEETPAGDDYEEEGFVDRKTAREMIKDAVLEERKANRMERGNSYFRRTYPEYIDDEDAISGILRSSKHRDELLRCASTEERVDFAVKKFRERLDKETATVKEQTETETKEREEKNRKAAGLGGASTAPTKSDDEGKSDVEELRDRKARLAKKRNLA